MYKKNLIIIILILMSVITWGALPKALDSNETIEQAIARLIQDHEDDANAHIDPGESLYDHKQSGTIDHEEGSVVADKLSFTEVVTHCDFQSLDSFSISDPAWVSITSGDAVTIAVEYGVENSNYFRRLIEWPAGLSDYNVDWLLQFVAWSNYDEGITARFILGGTAGNDGFGFEFANGVVRGFVRDGAAYSYTGDLTIDHTAIHLYRARYDTSTENFIFYVDGAELATIAKTSEIPQEQPEVQVTLDATSDIGDEVDLFTKTLMYSMGV